ncbi:MAG: MaoC family dehydratase, partial [Actinomycetota bacterium]
HLAGGAPARRDVTELVKEVTQDDMTLYSGPGNIHSDLEVARRTGLDATIAQGMMTLAFASELMTMVCGPSWLERGEIAVKFTKPVYAGNRVTVRAAEADGGYSISATNQAGDTLMVGEARLRD